MEGLREKKGSGEQKIKRKRGGERRMLLTEARQENKIKLLALIFFFLCGAGVGSGVGKEKRGDAVFGGGVGRERG